MTLSFNKAIHGVLPAIRRLQRLIVVFFMFLVLVMSFMLTVIPFFLDHDGLSNTSRRRCRLRWRADLDIHIWRRGQRRGRSKKHIRQDKNGHDATQNNLFDFHNFSFIVYCMYCRYIQRKDIFMSTIFPPQSNNHCYENP